MLKFELTARDKAQGCQGDSGNCPMALAINRYLKDGLYVKVYPVTIVIMKNFCPLHSLMTSAPVSDFIRRFDEYGDGELGTYEIDIPAEYLKTEVA